MLCRRPKILQLNLLRRTDAEHVIQASFVRLLKPGGTVTTMAEGLDLPATLVSAAQAKGCCCFSDLKLDILLFSGADSWCEVLHERNLKAGACASVCADTASAAPLPGASAGVRKEAPYGVGRYSTVALPSATRRSWRTTAI